MTNQKLSADQIAMIEQQSEDDIVTYNEEEYLQLVSSMKKDLRKMIQRPTWPPRTLEDMRLSVKQKYLKSWMLWEDRIVVLDALAEAMQSIQNPKVGF